MASSYISHVLIKDLWGDKDKKFDISFDPNMNIIIGRNASGKTTLINILHYSFTVNLSALTQIEFSLIEIELTSFSGSEKKLLRVTQNDEKTEISFGGLKVAFPIDPFRDGSIPNSAAFNRNFLRHRMGFEIQEIRDAIAKEVPAVWLPVSRRLPIADEEDAERRKLHRKPLESVDECLEGLLDGLQKYRVLLDVQLSELRKDFQKHALETILYDKQHDNITDFSSFDPPSEDDKLQLVQAFTDVGLIDPKVKKRIDEHFAAAADASKKVDQVKGGIHVSTLFIFPLMNRTKSMVRYARELEEQRALLFASLHTFEEIVSEFLEDKRVNVTNGGKLQITKKNRKRDELEWRNLSSGEKQILILLTQALLWERDPVVYVADEPELSLHVVWQEKLLISLKKLAGRCQFIVATHSPDIAGGFRDKIINLGKK